MGAKLIDANPYLRSASARKRSVLVSVATSSAIEGIHAPFKSVAKTASTGQKAGRKAAATVHCVETSTPATPRRFGAKSGR